MRGCLIGCTRCFFKPQHKDFRQHGRAPWLLWRFVGGVALAVQIVGSSGNTLVGALAAKEPGTHTPYCPAAEDPRPFFSETTRTLLAPASAGPFLLERSRAP